MKTTSLVVALSAAFTCLLKGNLSAQSTSLEGYSARLSWPVVENLIPQHPEIKEFLADGDYVHYVMVYHPAAAALVRRVNSSGVLEENYEFPELRDKVQDVLSALAEKDPRWKETLFRTEPADAKMSVSDAEQREREAALIHEVPEEFRALDEATLRAKLQDLARLLESAAEAGARAALEKEMRLLENALKNRRP